MTLGNLIPYVNRMKDQRTRNRVKHLKVDEVSLVDNPANASARFVLTKRDDIQKDGPAAELDEMDELEAELDELDEEINAMADDDESDEDELEDDEEDDIDDEDDEDDESDDVEDSVNEDAVVAAEAQEIVDKAYTTFESAAARTSIYPMIDALRESLNSIVNDENADAVEKRAAIKKSVGQFAKAADRLVGDDITKLFDGESMKTTAVLGRTSLEKSVERLHDQNAALQKRLDDRDHADRMVEARSVLGKRASDEDVTAYAELLKSNPKQAELVTRLAKRAVDLEKSSFKEIGSTEGADANSPEAIVEKKAEELRKNDPKLSRAQSIAKAYVELGDDVYVTDED